MRRSRMLAGLAIGLYLLAAALVFAWAWADRDTDDYAGWAPTVALLALPAALAIVADPPRTSHLHAAALVIPAGLASGSAACGISLRVIGWLRPDDATATAILAFTGPVFALAFVVVAWRYLLRWPLREGAAHLLAIVALLGVTALVVLAPAWLAAPAPGDLDIGATLLLLGALPLAWALGPALALLTGPRGAWRA